VTEDWSFREFGAEFDDHAEKHLPHYRLAHEVIGHAASFNLPPGGLVADLGCSTGQALVSLAAAMKGRPFTYVGYDSDESMLDQTRSRPPGSASVETHRVDLSTDQLRHSSAHVTLALWTLQFMPPETWQPVLSAALERAAPDGVLLVGAKTRLARDARWQEVADGALADWKAERGVGADEYLTKARSLRGTMLVVSLGRLTETIEAAGWCSSAVLFRWHAWAVVGAFSRPLD